MSRTKKGSQKRIVDQKNILSIIQSLVADWEATGSTFSHMNLMPTRFGIGIVFDKAWICIRCHNYQYDDLPKDLVCEECKKK